MIGCLGPAGGVRFDNGKSRERTCVTTYWGGRPFEIVTDEDLRRRAGSQDNTFFFPADVYLSIHVPFFFCLRDDRWATQKKKTSVQSNFDAQTALLLAPTARAKQHFKNRCLFSIWKVAGHQREWCSNGPSIHLPTGYISRWRIYWVSWPSNHAISKSSFKSKPQAGRKK